MCLSPGSCLQAWGPSVTWKAVEFPQRRQRGHYSAEMGWLAGRVAVWGQKSVEAESAPTWPLLLAAGIIGTEVDIDRSAPPDPHLVSWREKEMQLLIWISLTNGFCARSRSRARGQEECASSWRSMFAHARRSCFCDPWTLLYTVGEQSDFVSSCVSPTGLWRQLQLHY